jgi:uncharacterized protein
MEGSLFPNHNSIINGLGSSIFHFFIQEGRFLRILDFRHCVCLMLILFSVKSSVAFKTGDSTYSVIEELDTKVEMRDGVRLSANVFRPDAVGRFPALLRRTPYGNGGTGNSTGHFYAARGYAVVTQDCRGMFESEGTFDATRTEGEDGYDTQMWLGAQPWCNGRIGTFGGSYVGFTQWISAPEGCPYLLAMFPVVAYADQYDMSHCGGSFRVRSESLWSMEMSRPDSIDRKHVGEDMHQVLLSLPQIDQDRMLGWRVPYLRDWLSHPTRDKYWGKSSIYGRYHKITAAAFNVGGWFDICFSGTIRNFTSMTGDDISPEVRARQKILIGPWVHDISQDGKVGALDFGKESVIDFQRLQLEWFDYYLKDIKTPIINEPPVKIFVMGANIWRAENEWPLKRTRYVEYYLDSGGKANTRQGDGSLSVEAAIKSPPDRFTYDPSDPVPSTPMAPTDQREIEQRHDVLVYTTQPLDKELEVTGPLKVVLHAASSALNTDFTAKLVEVYPDGRAIKLADGIIRASFRNGPENPQNITPGEIYRYEIDLWSTSNLFRKGHRIRVDISSSSFPRFDRNLNTGNDYATDTTLLKADQTIYHSSKYPSCIVLPVID